MGSRERSGRWQRRATIAGIAAAALATPFLMGAAAPGAAGPTAPAQQRHLLSVAGADLADVTADVTAVGGHVVQAFPVASAVLVDLPDGAAVPSGAVAVPDQHFTFNGADTASSAPVNTYRQTIRASTKLAGDGVTVALVDTGVADTGEVDVTHVNVSGTPQGDGLGHGTFLAGLIAGDGASSGGAYAGVAPDAKILDVQVADATGGTSLTQVLAGLQAVADRQARDSSVKVVQLALSTGSPLPPWLDPLTRGLETLWSRGMTVVVAAGNAGEDDVTAPASDPTLLAVGAVDELKTADRGDDVVADFSSYGRTFGAERPDVVAPGVSLVSLRAPGSVADTENPNSRVAGKYFKGTGTSMSSAVASGAAAALLGERPQLRPNDVKRLLLGTAFDDGALHSSAGAGSGLVDLAKAVRTDVDATPKLKFQARSNRYGPAEEDAEAWAAFAQAWDDGDLRAAVAAWVKLSPQTRRWAANAWSLAVLARSLTLPDGDFAARRWAARRWVTQNWNARRWADDDWVARRWVALDWNARRWVDVWWEARRWVSNDWLAFAWSLRIGSDDDLVAQLWQDEDWAARRWVARRWVSTDWVARRWVDEAWNARRWADYVWDARRWVSDDWDARRWADEDFNARRWVDDDWVARRWVARRWASGEWDARRWVEFVFEARRWVTQDWSARRWAVTGWGS